MHSNHQVLFLSHATVVVVVISVEYPPMKKPANETPAPAPKPVPAPAITLAPEQRRIVTSRHPFVEVIACPGSGKTFTLAHRALHVANLASQHRAYSSGARPAANVASKLDARRILVLSFSKESVHVVKKALKQHGLRGATVSTVHALALKLIQYARRHPAAGSTKAPKPSTVLSEVQAHNLLRLAVSDLRRERTREIKKLRDRKTRDLAVINQLTEQRSWFRDLADSSADLHALLNLFAYSRASHTPLRELLDGSPAFAGQLAPTMFPFWERRDLVHEIQRAFNKRKREDDAIDFGDMVRKALPILEDDATSPAVMDFDHLLVDEYQDSSPQQVMFIAALARRIKSVMVFGDPQQAIYGFAGGGYTPLSSVLGGVQELNLPESRRLHSGTANFATALFTANSGTDSGENSSPRRRMRTLVDGPLPQIIIRPEFEDQLDELAVRIEKLIAKGVAPIQIVVLARIKAILTAVQMKLHRHGISVRHLGQRKEYLHIRRVLKLVRFCEQHAEHRTKPDRETVTALAEKLKLSRPSDEAVVQAVLELRRASTVLRSMSGRYQACAIAYLKLAGIRRRGGSKADDAVCFGINAWEPMCTHSSCGTAEEMLAQIRAYAAAGHVETRTIHGAKGREWDHVFVVGATEGVLPHYRARSELARREELNLMYVAATRAKKRLTLMHSPYTDAGRPMPQRAKGVAKPGTEKQQKREPFTKLSSLLDHRQVVALAVSKTR